MLLPNIAYVLWRQDSLGLFGAASMLGFMAVIMLETVRSQRRITELLRLRFMHEHVAGERARALEQARHHSDARSRFLATVSHEMRTPLHGILGLARVLQQDKPRADQRQRLALMERSGEHLLTVINDILDFSKIEAGRMSIEARPFELGEVLDLSLIHICAFEADLALVFNLAPEADIEVLAEFEQRLVAVMHRDHPLAARPSVRVRDCADYPLVLPNRDIGGRQLLERFLVRSSVKLRPVVESNSFEFLRGCLYHGQAVSFQIAIGTVEDGGELVARPLEDRNFPHGRLVLAGLRGRQLPVIAHAFAEHLKTALQGLGQVAA